MKYTVTAQWLRVGDLLAGPEVARELASGLQAIGATSDTGHEAVTFHLEAEDAVVGALYAGEILGGVLDGHKPAPGTTPAALQALTSITVETTPAPGDSTPRATRWNFPDLVNLSEIAAMAGVSRQRARQWSRERSDFPAPALVTSLGALYGRDVASTWVATGRRSSGRPRTN